MSPGIARTLKIGLLLAALPIARALFRTVPQLRPRSVRLFNTSTEPIANVRLEYAGEKYVLGPLYPQSPTTVKLPPRASKLALDLADAAGHETHLEVPREQLDPIAGTVVVRLNARHVLEVTADK